MLFPPSYQQWPECVREAELAALAAVQPGAWQDIVLRLTEAADPEHRTIRSGKVDDPASHRYHGNLRDCDKLMVRLLRYLSSEQVFSLVLSGPGSAPFLRFASAVRGEKLNEIYSKISKGQVPSYYGAACSASVSFQSWLARRVAGDEGRPLCPTLVRYLQAEGAFLADRTFVNAIKHSRAFFGGPEAVGVSVQLDDRWVELMPASEVIFTKVWTETRVNGSMTFSAFDAYETFKFEEDIGVIHVNSLLSRAILNIRISKLRMLEAGAEAVSIKFFVPDNISFSNSVGRFKNMPSLKANGEQSCSASGSQT